MAIDAYLKIDGINGESEDDKHRNWIEVSNVMYAIHQPRAEVLSTAGGQDHPKAVFEFMRADGDGKAIPYFKIELENLMIANITPDSGDGGIISEGAHLAYAKIKWNYTRQSIRGGAQGNTSGGWDCSANKVC